MKRPITMRCNEYQFNEIKDKLKGSVNLTMLSKFDSNESFYLINHLCEEQNTVTNVVNPIKRDGVVFYEEWNEKIFLEACGIEVEKTFSITESQIEVIEKVSCNKHIAHYLKSWFPEAFESEVKELNIGTWYKMPEHKKFLGVVTKIEPDRFWYYGFNTGGSYKDSDFYGTNEILIEATEQEVFEALKKECVKRNILENCFIKETLGLNIGTHKHGYDQLQVSNEDFIFDFNNNILFIGNLMVFKCGKWVELQETITLSEAEQQLKKKIIV